MNVRELRTLALPAMLVAVLAGILGFFVTHSVVGPSKNDAAQISVVAIPPTPTPSATPEPSETPTSGSVRSGRTRDPRCPIGCECQFPPGGTVVVCHGGGTVKVP